MKKNYWIIAILLMVFNAKSQEIKKEEYIIYANESKNTSLILPNPIKKAIVGNTNFMFGYNKTEPSNIGVLKANFGEESNLLIITENGNIYSFIIRYSKENNILTYFIKDNQAVGNENGNVILASKNENKKSEKEISNDSTPIAVVNPITVNNFQNQKGAEENVVYDKVCLLEIEKSIFYNRIYGTKDNVFVKLKNITYVQSELYFSLILTNNSTLDYDINYINFYITSRNKKKNTTTQTIPYKPKYIYNHQTKLKLGETIEMVFVYDKFSINENKILLVELTEDNGERTVKLEIPNTFINNPN